MAQSKFIQSVVKAAKGRPRSTEWFRDKIKEFGKPIVSTSANVSGEPTPKSFSEISQAILKSVDYVVNLHQEKVAEKSSTILKIEGEAIIVIRE